MDPTRMKDSPSGVGTMRLSIDQPFDLASSLESGQAHRWRRDRQEAPEREEGWLWGVICGTLIKIRPAQNGFEEAPYSVAFESAPASEPGYMQSLLRSYFRLEDDIEAIYQEITRDSRVASMVQKYRGLRLLRMEPWECFIAFICSANSNMARIHANLESVSERFGNPVDLDGHTRYTFPTPDRLAEAGEATLRELGLGFRAPYVAQGALAVVRGDLDFDSLKRMPYQEAQARLMELPGIGPKISDCILLHSLDKLEAFPIDVWVKRALQEWYFHGTKMPSYQAVTEWALDHFGQYAGYAELYLFHGRRLKRSE